MNVIEVGFRIKQAIGLSGLSVKEFCEKSKRSRVTTALWIAGRGGVIKESSFDTLCFDLKQLNVLCNKEWLISGHGTPPTLAVQDKASTLQEDTAFEFPSSFRYDLSMLKKSLQPVTDTRHQDFWDAHYYCISKKADPLDIKKHKFVHIRTNTEEVLAIFEGLCKTRQTLVMSTMDNKFLCLGLQEIVYIGEVVFYIDKRL